MSTIVSSPASIHLPHHSWSNCRRDAYGGTSLPLSASQQSENEKKGADFEAVSQPDVHITDTVTLPRRQSLPALMENLHHNNQKQPAKQEQPLKEQPAREQRDKMKLGSPESSIESPDVFVEIPLTPPVQKSSPLSNASVAPVPVGEESYQLGQKKKDAPQAHSVIELPPPPVEVEMHEMALPVAVPQRQGPGQQEVTLAPPPVVIQIPVAVPQPQRRQPQLPVQDPPPPSCWDSINIFSHIKQYFVAKAEKKEAKRQAKLQAEAVKQQKEMRLRETFSSMHRLYDKLFGAGVNLVINPNSVRNTEDEYLHCYKSYPTLRREADLSVQGQNYHLTLQEMRKANPKKRTRHDYMHPYTPNKKEEDQVPSFPVGTIITAKLNGPNPEEFVFKRWPDPTVVFPDTRYVEQNGKEHKRSYAYFKRSLVDRDIRKGDSFIQNVLLGKLKSLFIPVQQAGPQAAVRLEQNN